MWVNMKTQMQLSVVMEYHILPGILQVNLLTRLYCVIILSIIPNISSQQTKMIKSGPGVMNNVTLTNCRIFMVIESSWLKGKFSLKA